MNFFFLEMVGSTYLEGFDFSNMTDMDKKIFVKIMLNRQKTLGEQIPIPLVKARFLSKIHKVYFEKTDEIVQKLNGKMTENQVIEIISAYF